MSGNSNNRPIGRCSQCGGVVSVPISHMSVNRPAPSCESCGAVADPAAHLPVIKTTPVATNRVRTATNEYVDLEEEFGGVRR